MRCEQTREYLSAYIEGELEPGLRLNVDQHLEQCASCRQDMEAIGEVFAVLGAPALLQEPPEMLHYDVLRRIRLEQNATRSTPLGWLRSVSWGWRAGASATVAVAAMLAIILLGPLHSGITGGFGRLPGTANNSAVLSARPLTVAGSGHGFRLAGSPEDLLVDITAARAGHWKLNARTSSGISLPLDTPADGAGDSTVWQGDLAAGKQQRVPVTLMAQAAGSVHEVRFTLSGPTTSDTTVVSAILAVQVPTSAGSALNWRTAPNATLLRALVDLDPYLGKPISVEADALAQPVSVNMSNVRADDILDAVAAAAALKVDRSEGAYNLYK